MKPRIIHFNVSWKPWLATPLTRTWAARRPFEASFADMPALWKAAYPNRLAFVGRMEYHAAALQKALKESAGAAKRRAAFLRYLAATRFIDSRFDASGAPGEV